ncbi:hypothetical protein [Methylocella sp.]|uniref:hypothetical protein n=1 Tax=Methylocella sp. TaxID=1978226 RepID=UPI0035B076DC
MNEYAQIAIWLTFVVALGGLLWLLSAKLSSLARALGAMWAPLVVTAVAAFVLLFNDQGQELGVGLMNEPGFRLLWLFLALIYWALNNWHAGRLGLERLYSAEALARGVAREDVINGSKWAFWAPRIIGVCAHLLAALHLARAAATQPEFLSSRSQPYLGYLPYAAPAAILAATALLWSLDYRIVSRRSAARPYKKLADVVFRASAGVECLLAGVMVYALVSERFPAGFVWATLWIVLSAAAFLLLISHLRKNRASGVDETAALWNWTLGLAAPLPLAVIVSVYAPLAAGRAFGSLIIGVFAFGAFLAAVTFCSRAAEWLAARLKRRWPGATPRAVVSFALVGLVALAVVTSFIRPFHRVRLCDKGDCAAAPPPLPGAAPTGAATWTALKDPASRPTVEEAAKAWYAQASAAYAPAHPGKPVPMLVIATAGGGIRAAVWTAAILQQLEAELELSKDATGGLRSLLFAVSAVSGGSVGAVAYLAAVAAHEADPQRHKAIAPASQLGQDFLAPGLLRWIFVDGPSNVLPELTRDDRGVALETGFEEATDHMLANAFLSFFPDKETAASRWRPILLLNATHQETGRRIITSNVKIERQVFQDSYDAFQILGADMRASTAAHNSARFTYVSPAGNLIAAGGGENRGYIIDGGYFENYGAATALELSREAARAINGDEKPPKVRRVVLLISSDPGLDAERARVRLRQGQVEGKMKCVLSTATPARREEAGAGNFLPFKDAAKNEKNDGEGFILSSYNELTAPLFGVMSVREAHGVRAAEELAAEICAEQPVSAGAAPANPEKLQATVSEAAKTSFEETQPWPARDDHSFFAHLAMCGEEKGDPPPAKPPLGWVLSRGTREAIGEFLKNCGNETEYSALKTALGVPR